jgi:UDP-N-acetyl-D-mannosaminuronate dehydrogenase
MIVTDHSELDYAHIRDLAKVFVDTRAAAARADRSARRTATVSA